MKTKEKIISTLQKRIVILDGATGTELSKRGMPQGIMPEAWVLENPGTLKAIHAEYGHAGADIVYACTFGANRIKLAEYGMRNVAEINHKLILLAKEAVNGRILVAGDIGPTGRFVKPFGKLGFEEAVAVFKEQIRGLCAGGADLLVIETMMDIQEARAALIAAKEMTGAFVMVTMTFDHGGRTLFGTDPLSALITLQGLGADAVGVNCATGPEGMQAIIKSLKPFATVPLVAKPNAGIPTLIGRKTVFAMGPESFAKEAKKLITAGVNMLGGCCGTTPRHIRFLKDAVSAIRPQAVMKKSVSALSSARKAVIIDAQNPPLVIGEKINPTGKKSLQQELLAGHFSLLRALAIEQQAHKPALLDVNVGVPHIDEKKAMQGAIEALAGAVALPLVIDSANPCVIEAALRTYPGRALINSISAEKERLRLLPIVRKYGAMFILLPLSGKGIPSSLFERKRIIRKVFNEAKRRGFTKDDIIVDGLVMSMASNPEFASLTLKTVEWARRVFGVHTVIGLSNVSFGLPNRQMINAAFLAMALRKGLTCAIADPLIVRLLRKKMIQKIVSRKGAGPEMLRDCFPGQSHTQIKPLKKIARIEDKIYQAILEGNRDSIEALLKEGLAKGLGAYRIIEELVIPAIMKVGDLFDKKIYFLPQLIAGAESVRNAFSYLKPHIKKDFVRGRKKNLILMATVKGDIHDIGKNIVILILESNGFKVVDLGKDVSAQK
ncbi:MAG: homocysteine S-methyltransferase family protein, partial [Candidatus Omnitrophota bacterium]